MKKIFLLIFLLLPTAVFAQSQRNPCYYTGANPGPGNGCIPVSTVNPLPTTGGGSGGSSSPFTPSLSYSTLTATASSSASTALPTNTGTVAFQNQNSAAVSCTLSSGSATAAANQIIVPAGSTIFVGTTGYTNAACINQTGSASNVIVMAGGSGLGTGFGGGGSGGGGGSVTQGTTPWIVGGADASGVAATAAPVGVGGVYNFTKPTFSAGNRGDLQIGTRGSTVVQISPPDSSAANTFVAAGADTQSNSFTAYDFNVFNNVFNGTTWDRQRTVAGDAQTGTGIATNVLMLWNGATYDRLKGTGGVASVGLASGAVASGAYSAGSFAAGAVIAGAFVDGWDITEGTKTDAPYAGTGSASVIAILKGIYAAATNPLAAQTSAVWIGNVGQNGSWSFSPAASATGGATPTSAVAAASNNSTNIKGSAGAVFDIQTSNINTTTPYYLKLYDKATAPTCGTDTPIWRGVIPPNFSGNNAMFGISGKAFTSGLGYCITAGIADSDNTSIPATTVLVNLDWK